MGLTIELNFLGGIDAKARSALYEAAARWAAIIKEDLPLVRLSEGDWICGIRIDVEGIDRPHAHGITGIVGPTHLRADSLLPARGLMQLDTRDLDRVDTYGSLLPVMLHQMAHVLGFGILWSSEYLNLLDDQGGYDPIFTGEKATAFYSELTGHPQPGVPVENTGGRGNRDVHWRERLLGHELMTGHLDEGINPLSRLTLAAMEDMGYTICREEAEAFFILPPEECLNRRLDLHRICRTCQSTTYSREIIVLESDEHQPCESM